jgi:imidazolonepropionase-like amidohydrolase
VYSREPIMLTNPAAPFMRAMRMMVVTMMLVAALGAASRQTGQDLAIAIAISNVIVINPCRDATESGRTVIVESGRIRAVQPASMPTPTGARVIDGTGKYLIPGLWDSHVHLTKAGVTSLPLFLANGVTAVRDMGSDLDELVGWRSRIAAGTLAGPRIKTSGQMLESQANVDRMKREGGVEPVDRLRIGLATPADAQRAVDRLAADGADLIKVRSTPDLNTFRATADAARRHGLRLACHPVGGPADLAQARTGSIEHWVSYPPLRSRPDTERRALWAELAAVGTFISTTFVNVDQSILVPYEEARRRVDDVAAKLDPRRKYIGGYLVEDWREQVEEKKAESIEPFRKDVPGFVGDLRELREARVPFLAGTDVGVAFMYPGFTLHDELDLLVHRLGFSPMETLRIATHNPAMFFGLEKEIGCLEAGQIADLVLLDANPLSDIRNTRTIRGVITAGRWLDRSALDQMLSKVEQQMKLSMERATNAREGSLPLTLLTFH